MLPDPSRKNATMTTPDKPLRFNLSATMAKDPNVPATPPRPSADLRFDVAQAMKARSAKPEAKEGSRPYSLTDAMRRRVESEGAA